MVCALVLSVFDLFLATVSAKPPAPREAATAFTRRGSNSLILLFRTSVLDLLSPIFLLAFFPFAYSSVFGLVNFRHSNHVCSDPVPRFVSPSASSKKEGWTDSEESLSYLARADDVPKGGDVPCSVDSITVMRVRFFLNFWGWE